LIAIPARYASTRYPGKPLVPLHGASGQAKSLVQRSWEAARQVAGVDRVVIATDDERIRATAADFGAEVVMTSSACRNGTERCAEVAQRLPEYDIVVNLQGDAPLTPPWFVEGLVAEMTAHKGFQVATPVLRCDAEALAALREDRRHDRVGGTTAVFDVEGRALYFSKEVIPYHGPDAGSTPVYHHVGVYAYRRAALLAYPEFAEGRLERSEGLEQLRFLENAIPVHCVEVEARGTAFWELNNPGDVARIEAILARQGIA